MAKYIATARGFDGRKVREIGETFDFAGKKGSWMEPVGGAEKAAVTVSSSTSSNALTEADKINGPTRNELMAALKEKGIKFLATMKKEELAELLVKGNQALSEPESGTGTPPETVEAQETSEGAESQQAGSEV